MVYVRGRLSEWQSDPVLALVSVPSPFDHINMRLGTDILCSAISFY